MWFFQPLVGILKAAWPFAAGILLCEGVGALAAVATQSSVETWYPTLAKHFFTIVGRGMRGNKANPL